VKKNAPAQAATTTAGAAREYYTCPMHESIRSDAPGACPDCGMTLVKKSVQNKIDALDLSTLKAVSLSPSQRVMANVTTARVERRTITHDVQAVGVVSFAEPNYQVISLRFPGRIEKLYLTFAGQTVRKGDPVAQVYSPDVIAEEQAYLRTLEAYRQTAQTGEEYSGAVGQSLRRSTIRLLQLGFTAEQIEDLGNSDTLSSFVTICSPVTGTVVKKRVDPGSYFEGTGAPLFDVADLSTVWILLDVYEKDIRLIRTGQSVLISTEAYPLDEFRGRIVFVDPVLTPETRTIRVRTEAANPQGKLKPNMYVNATIAVPQSRELVVPTTAIVPATKRSIVWVETKENLFEPREIRIGASNESYTVVLSGLEEGEIVARTGGFLIDSESALSWTQGNDHEE
jgi:membrane fusion protein, copper/silver efflux system